ncbi:hypothetical protein J2S43_002618 [Catenuloplanes nepalensis]|uniref:Lipoprotein n=1 Tax=Catenuloplanes nepalensis TaxID=587533 RepID=A0ABT9MSV5_9ACTN|nr:hypothetical protein [Catenuloplanes nepalensis]MDP9794106.1 hypothetical protein [Catenuloplanes nepalensis]
MASTVFCVSVLALSACGGDDSTTETDAAAPAPSAAAATTGAPAASEAPAAAGASDKEICEAAVASTNAFKKEMLDAVAAGKEVDTKKAWSDLAGTLAVAEGGTSDVAEAAQVYATELKTAAAAADPVAAGESPSFGKAGTDFDAACTAVGVPTIG